MSRSPAAPDARRSAEEAQRMTRARRMAWGLALLAIAFYVGFMVLTAIEGPR